MPSQVDGDFAWTGQHSFTKAPALPAGTVGNTQTNVSDPITGAKLYHRYRKEFGQPNGAANVTERRVVHIAKAAGTVNEFKTTITAVLTGAATANIDLLKNGTSILSGTVNFSNADAAFALKSGTVVTAPYVANDVFEVKMTVTLGGGTATSGLSGQAEFEEAPS